MIFNTILMKNNNQNFCSWCAKISFTFAFIIKLEHSIKLSISAIMTNYDQRFVVVSINYC